MAHFACHGEWRPDEPMESALLLAGVDRLTLGQLLEPQVRLQRVRLVVLSSCESSLGYRPESSGEEFLGLPAGFVVAGAKAVVGSLWSALDPPTARLMVRLHQGLLASKGVAAALQQAQWD